MESTTQSQPKPISSPLERVTSTGPLSSNGTVADEPERDAQVVEKGAAVSQQRQGPKKFSHGWFDPELAPLRKIVYKIVGGAMGLTILIMWICIPLYWGALYQPEVYSHKLEILVVSYDSPSTTTTPSLGSWIQQATINNTMGLISQIGPYDNADAPIHTLGWVQANAADWPNSQDVINAVLDEKYWAAIVINTDATANLLSARQSGTTTYDPRSAVTFYYNQGRNENAAGSYILPITNSLMGNALATWNSMSVADYLGSISGNANALTALIAAPQTIATGASYTQNNLRPYNAPVFAAIGLVGLIYVTIFAFIFTMNWTAARDIIGPFLRTRTLIIIRMVVPLMLYGLLSLLFAMINLPFKVPFDAKYTYAGGFFLWWICLWIGMASLGLALEFAITWLGPKFISFFLLPLIIVNVSVVTLPADLQPRLYGYQPAAPMYQLNRIARTILFDTKNGVGEGVGIILAWMVCSLITLPISTWLVRRKALREHRKTLNQEVPPEKRRL